MTTRIFFNNATGLTIKIFDRDNNYFGILGPGQYSSLKLNYSSTFNKAYYLLLFNTTTKIYFSLDINGEILSIGTGPIILEIGSESGLGWIRNKLIINPGPNVPLSPPQCIPFNSPALIYYNDY